MNGWMVGGLIVCASALGLAFLILRPPRVSVSGIPDGFTEKQFDTGEVVLNYVEGPDNGVPLLLIPGQMESWQGYKLVMPAFTRRFHVFSVDLRGHGKSTRTPGKYSYNACGNDLVVFLREVVKEPAIVSGLSSGAVLSVWLAAYAPDYVLGAVSEDPPMFSSIWPRIRDERFMTYMFQNAIDTLGNPEGRDLRAYYMGMGVPRDGKEKLLYIPAPIVNVIMGLHEMGRKLRPDRPYDAPLLAYSLRAGFKFLSEYDVDFSRATIDGRLSEGFDPEDALKKAKCPVLLLHASSSRDRTWGLLGAMDDADVEKIRSLVTDLRTIDIKSRHEIHMAKPEWYLEQVGEFADECLKDRG